MYLKTQWSLLPEGTGGIRPFAQKYIEIIGSEHDKVPSDKPRSTRTVTEIRTKEQIKQCYYARSRKIYIYKQLYKNKLNKTSEHNRYPQQLNFLKGHSNKI
jgi:hypothetical protein